MFKFGFYYKGIILSLFAGQLTLPLNNGCYMTIVFVLQRIGDTVTCVTSSSCPVDSLWPATLITSSTRAVMAMLPCASRNPASIVS